jgi:hypothetical protein
MSHDKDNLHSPVVETLWFIARGETLMGPFTANQIADKVSSREFSALDYCWRQGFSEWRPVNSVEEFDRRGKIKTLSPYPTVEIPGALNPKQFGTPNSANFNSAKTTLTKKVSHQKKDKIEITFAKVRRGPLSIYEWAGALVFCLLFSYLSVDFALNEVEKNLMSRFQFIRMGAMKSDGFIPNEGSPSGKVTPLWMWDPLLSAPGIKEVNQLENLRSKDPGIPVLPQNFAGFYNQTESSDWLSSAQNRAPATEPQKKNQLEFDPMISGFTWYRGVFQVQDKAKLKVTPAGSPLHQFP